MVWLPGGGKTGAEQAAKADGRPAAISHDTLDLACARKMRGQSMTEIARELGIGRSTLYRALEGSSA